MAEDSNKNSDLNNFLGGEDNNSGQQGLSLGAILNDSMQDGEIFDALAFLDSKPEEKKKKAVSGEKSGKKEKNKEEKSPAKTEKKKDSVMDSLMEAATMAAAEEKKGKKEEKHQFLYRPESASKPKTAAAEPAPAKKTDAGGLKTSPDAHGQAKRSNPFKVPVPPPAHKKTVQIMTAFEFDSEPEKQGENSAASDKNNKLNNEKSKESAANSKNHNAPAEKAKNSKSRPGSKKKLAAAFLLVLIAGAAMLMFGRKNSVNKPSDPSALAMNKNSVSSENVSIDYSENISDWIPKNSAENMPESPSWISSDAGAAMASTDYPLGLEEGQQGFSWRADFGSDSSSDDDEFAGYSWRSSDYDSSDFSSYSGNSASSDYYSNNFSFGGGLNWSGGSGTSMTSGGGSSGGSYSSSSSDDGDDDSSSGGDDTVAAVQNVAPKGSAKKGRAVSGPDTSYSSGGNNSNQNNFEYKLQTANSSFGTSSDISAANYGSSFDQGGGASGGGESGHAEAFSGGGIKGGPGGAGIDVGDLKNSLKPGDAPKASEAQDATGEKQNSDGTPSGSGGGSGGSPSSSGGGATPSSSGGSTPDNTVSADKDAKDGKNAEDKDSKDKEKSDSSAKEKDKEKETEKEEGKETGKENDKDKEKEKDKDKEKDKENTSKPAAKPAASASVKKCSGELANFSPGESGQLQSPYKERFLSAGRTFCTEGCGGKYYRYFDKSLEYFITSDCKVNVIIKGYEVENDYSSDSSSSNQKNYTDTYLVLDPASGSDIQRIGLSYD